MQKMWSGAITFGLLHIPVHLYSGSQSNTLDLDMLRKSDQCRIRYKRVCEKDGKDVPYEEIVRGYEYSDGEYVILTDNDFKSANVEKTYTIEVLDFVSREEIDLRYFEKPYYLEPDKTAAKPYALLREALKESKKVGIASYVLRNRGNIGVLTPVENALVLNQMRYADEVRDMNELKIPEAKNLRDEEIKLALSLIEQLTSKFDAEKYRDSYRDDLMRIIEDKARGKKPVPKGKKPPEGKVYDLMSVLKRSLEQEKKKKKVA
jgi:DNA end-binding protein Ku